MRLIKSLWYNEDMKKVCEGFTLVELSLSMIFVGLLSLSVAMVVNNTVVSYRRSNTLSQVNSVGMDIVEGIRAAAQASSAKSLIDTCGVQYKLTDGSGATDEQYDKCENDEAYNFVSVSEVEAVTVNDVNIGGVPVYGVFCTGTYSYIWNSGYYWLEDAYFASKAKGSTPDEWKWAQLKYKDGGSNKTIKNSDQENNMPFRLLKVRDDDRAVCIKAYENSSSEYPNSNTTMKSVIDITGFGNGELVEEPLQLLASKGADNLALYDLTVAKPAVSTENNSIFYAVSFILGTIDGGINITSANSACKAPDDYDSNLDYCAINKFSFAIRAAGE